MGAIIQTLTLATVLLIIGLVCLALGVAGLIWSTGRDRRRAEKSREAARSAELAGSVPHQP
jgi:flagellar basal body-associated protein FliL